MLRAPSSSPVHGHFRVRSICHVSGIPPLAARAAGPVRSCLLPTLPPPEQQARHLLQFPSDTSSSCACACATGILIRHFFERERAYGPGHPVPLLVPEPQAGSAAHPALCAAAPSRLQDSASCAAAFRPLLRILRPAGCIPPRADALRPVPTWHSRLKEPSHFWFRALVSNPPSGRMQRSLSC